MALIAKDVSVTDLARDIGARATIAEQTLALWREAVRAVRRRPIR